jgi:toxin HigB-1
MRPTRSANWICLFELHPVRGDLAAIWAVTAWANWRIVMRFEKGHAYEIDLTDYH